MEIGDRLKAERLRLGYNQTDFAALAGVTKNSQFNYEKGDRNPDAAYLAAINAAGVDVMYVITGQRSLAAAEGLAPEEAQLLEDYRRLPPDDQAAVRRHLKALAMMQAD